MEKINIKRLSDEIKTETATEFMMNRDIITNSAEQIINKINELVGAYNIGKARVDAQAKILHDVVRRIDELNDKIGNIVSSLLDE